jgi:hypothetical protein
MGSAEVNRAVSLLSLLCSMRGNGFCQSGPESGRLKAIEEERLFCIADSDGATKGYCKWAWVNRDISIVFTASQ